MQRQCRTERPPKTTRTKKHVRHILSVWSSWDVQWSETDNNNNRLFMAPHLMRAQGAYKADKHATHTHAYTHTNTPHPSRKNTSIVVIGLMETEASKREISRQKRRGGFSVLTWKRRVTWHAWQRKKESSRWQVRYTERISPQESSCTPLGHGKSEYLRLNEENEKENRGEATRRGMEELYQR